MANDVTPSLGLPMPSAENKLQDDVLKLREALSILDTKLQDVDETMGQLAFASELRQSVQQLTDAISGILQTKVDKVNGKVGTDITLKPEDVKLGPSNGPSSTTISYDANGRVSVAVEQIDGAPATTTIEYNADSTASTITTIYRGRTRTERLTYQGGKVSKVEASEVQS